MKQKLTKAASTKKTTTKKIVTKSSSVVNKKLTTTKQSIILQTKAANSLTDNFILKDDANIMIATANEQGIGLAMDYPKNIIEELLRNDNVKGIRIYSAIDNNGSKTFVIKGYDENNIEVLINREGVLGAIDMGQPCNPDVNAYKK